MWIAEPTNVTLKSAGRMIVVLDARLVYTLEPLQTDRRARKK
jgi:hypothetical protein